MDNEAIAASVYFMIHGFDPSIIRPCWPSCITHRQFFSVSVGFILSAVGHMVNGFPDIFTVSGQKI